MKVFASLLIALGSRPTAVTGAPPENCCCRPASGGECSVQKFCTKNGFGTCDSTCDCSGGGPSPTSTPPTCTNAGDDVGGPQIAMAWVSDQFANFDMEHDWSDNCNAGNEFKCCHDWLVDSFAGINTVSLTFLKPTEIMDPSKCFDHDLGVDRCTLRGDGVRKGMPGAIEYFNSTMERVFLSIGGATYTDSWEAVLSENAAEFALKVVDIARYYNVGIEIDYEKSANARLDELGTFMQTYRDEIPFDDSDDPYPPSLITIDFGQGAQFMGPIANWLAKNAFNTTNRLINWANAMVAGGRQSRVTDLIEHWGQHVHGYSTLQNFPIAPAYLVGSIWSSGRAAQESCIGTGDPDDGSLVLEDSDLVDFITNVEPCIDKCGECKEKLPQLDSGKSYTKGMLGYAYWMCGNISPRRSNTCPTSVLFDVYGTDYDGDGDCTAGFTRAANKYGEIDNTINWTARVY